MTRANLMRIVEQYNLYPSYRATKANEEILQRLTKDIKLDLLKADVIDVRSGSKTNATIAFSLSYEGETPAVAQKVTNELVTLFLGENLKNRQQKTAETSAFLAEEAAKLSVHEASSPEPQGRHDHRGRRTVPRRLARHIAHRVLRDADLGRHGTHGARTRHDSGRGRAAQGSRRHRVCVGWNRRGARKVGV